MKWKEYKGEELKYPMALRFKIICTTYAKDHDLDTSKDAYEAVGYVGLSKYDTDRCPIIIDEHIDGLSIDMWNEHMSYDHKNHMVECSCEVYDDAEDDRAYESDEYYDEIKKKYLGFYVRLTHVLDIEWDGAFVYMD